MVDISICSEDDRKPHIDVLIVGFLHILILLEKSDL